MKFTHTANPVKVLALLILGVHEITDGAWLALEDTTNYFASHAMLARYTPVAGDYLVTQDDGYQYVNPKDVFERKYSTIKPTLPDDHPVSQIAKAGGGTIEHVARMPDGSGAATISFPLPAGHWLTQPGENVPPMEFRLGTDDPERHPWAEKIRAAARYAVRASTMNGAEDDFDPDAMVQNMIVGMLGYWTPDGTTGTSDLQTNAAIATEGAEPGQVFVPPAPEPGALMCFSGALLHLKGGARIARTGWNGKGMFVYMVPANAYPAQTGAAKEYFGDNALVLYGAYLALKGVDSMVTPWAPSVSDTLAEDWLVLVDHHPV